MNRFDRVSLGPLVVGVITVVEEVLPTTRTAHRRGLPSRVMLALPVTSQRHETNNGSNAIAHFICLIDLCVHMHILHRPDVSCNLRL